MVPPKFPNHFCDPSCSPWTYETIACPCCGHCAFDLRLYYALRTVYAYTRKGFRITSLARCASHNHSVGGKPESRHIYGLAADITPNHGTLHDLAHAVLMLRPFRDGGLGYYPTRGIIHVDIRVKPFRWVRDSQGDHPCADLWPDLAPDAVEHQCQTLDDMPLQEPPQPPARSR